MVYKKSLVYLLYITNSNFTFNFIFIFPFTYDPDFEIQCLNQFYYW